MTALPPVGGMPQESESAPAFEREQVPRNRSIMGKISRFVWDTDNKSEEERLMVQRIDIGLMTYGCLMYFTKYLNQANISNAYASGMKEALDFQGNQYNVVNTMFVVGYLIGQLPGPLLMIKVSPAIWLPACEITWSVLVLCCAAAKNAESIYALRFLIGIAESTAYPGMIWLLSSWYTPSEMGKRAVIFINSSSVGTMFSGYLQAAVLGLDGRGGLAGYQWLFIVDGCLSIAIACLGFFMIPNLPNSPNPRARWWLKEKDVVMAQQRMAKLSRKGTTGLSIAKFKKAFSTWVPYVFLLPYIFYGQELYSYAYMNLWLKSAGYSTANINLIPTAGNGIAIGSGLLMAWISDALNNRGGVIIASNFVCMIGCIILSAWPASTEAKLAGFFLNFTVVSNGAITLTWIGELLSEDAEVRAIVIGFISSSIYVFSAWVPNLIFPASLAPNYPIGYKFIVACSIVANIFLALAMFLSRRYPIRSRDVQDIVQEVTLENYDRSDNEKDVELKF